MHSTKTAVNTARPSAKWAMEKKEVSYAENERASGEAPKSSSSLVVARQRKRGNAADDGLCWRLDAGAVWVSVRRHGGPLAAGSGANLAAIRNLSQVRVCLLRRPHLLDQCISRHCRTTPCTSTCLSDSPTRMVMLTFFLQTTRYLVAASMPIAIGHLSIPQSNHGRVYRPVKDSEETRNLQPGDIVESDWGHIFEWDSSCVSEEVVQRWRQEGDKRCDEALKALFPDPSTHAGKDLLAALEEHGKARGSNDIDPAFFFLDAIYEQPPDDLCITEQEYRIASDFFLDYAVQIAQALLYYSLAGGFASPRIVKTLHAVSYLVPHGQTRGETADGLSSSPSAKKHDDRTFIRLMETFQFALDVMDCTLPPVKDNGPSTQHTIAHILPGGEGWKAAVRIRMLHGVARHRAQARFEKSEAEGVDFVPINQEDMSATLGAFSTVPLWCLARFGLPASPEQASAYVALWRHIGFYLGVSPAILRKYFATPHTSGKYLASAAIHLFSVRPSISGSTELLPPTLPVLHAMSGRPPLYTTFAFNCALARFLLGPSLSSHLGIPHTKLTTYLKLHAVLIGQRLPLWFLRWYPRQAWITKRRAVIREGLVRITYWNLGMRRTSFRPRTGYTGVGREEGGDTIAGSEGEKIVFDSEGGKMLVRSMREVWVEMVAVLVSVSVGTAYILWIVVKAAFK
ncbi:hypothetical protein EVG20_g8151 [Dentipellis fragilis]|uniref:ER-bound oxygenase mpaB/mpaB'/Rubber oxygenase catalytic domain-containing protein n=1 Tax=Dentipellis fragilis TaxID=205917 RepID=A0A4Y9Y9M3_9AGAM|nr:hypothetical protein EVG20_g8151 [Dentipellis fragilis]